MMTQEYETLVHEGITYEGITPLRLQHTWNLLETKAVQGA